MIQVADSFTIFGMRKKTLLRLAAAALALAACSSQPASPPASERRADILLQAGVAALEQHDYTTALRSLLEAARENPKSAAVWNNLGIAYAGKTETTKAEECWKKALHADAKQNDARLNLGILYIRKKRYLEAEYILKEAAKDLGYRKLDQVALQLAQIHLAKGQPRLAEEQIKAAVRENPGNCGAWMSLGLMQKDRGEYAEAATSLKSSVMGSCYKNPRAHYEIASLYLKARDMHNAKTKLLEIIQLFPSSEWATRSEATLNMIR